MHETEFHDPHALNVQAFSGSLRRVDLGKSMVLDDETILACSRSASFQRGKKYYLERRVKNLKSDGVTCEATVIGTSRYDVKLNLTTLEGTCDCYAFDGSTWCKHMVAVGLAVSQTNGDDDKAAAHGEVKTDFQSGTIHTTC